jgi:beta-galactosidase/beta-glucuronidase
MATALVQAITASPVETECLPRPEHPQPQFQRREWQNLNGVWDFEFDDDNVGLAQNWHAAGTKLRGKIIVPFSFESPMSGVGDSSFHAQVWYSRTFELPEAWSGHRVLLHFGAVDYRAMVWVNGHFAGEHEGGHTPFDFDVTNLLIAGSNKVTLRVEDPPTDKYIPRGKQHWEHKSSSIFYTRTTGIWQTVWLEPVGLTHIETTRIRSKVDGSVTFDAKIAHPVADSQLTVTITYKGKLIASGTTFCQGTQATVSAFVRDPHLWSPDSPALYDIALELTNGGVMMDRVESYFGFRSVSTHDGKLLLNGNPLYLKTVLDQGYWPESNLTPPSDEAIRFDIEKAKELGFNGVRKHQKIEDPRFYYWADKMGLLVSAEMANAYMFDEDATGRITREWIDAMNRDCNHPSIIIWVPINESWGVPNLAEPTQQAHLKAMYYLTKSLDPTRLVIDNDGWEHTDCTDLFAIHDYTKTGKELLERFNSVPRGTLPLPKYGKMYLAPGQKYNGSPIFLSEFGGVGHVLPEDVNEIPENSWGYCGLEFSNEAALERMQGLYAAIAKVPAIMGVCYTQLYDVEQEINGLLTYDRRDKFDPKAIHAMNGLLE